MAECRAGTGRTATCAWKVSDEFYGWQRGFGLVVAVGSTFFISRNFLSRAVAATFYLHSTSAFEQQWMGGLKAVLLWAD